MCVFVRSSIKASWRNTISEATNYNHTICLCIVSKRWWVPTVAICIMVRIFFFGEKITGWIFLHLKIRGGDLFGERWRNKLIEDLVSSIKYRWKSFLDYSCTQWSSNKLVSFLMLTSWQIFSLTSFGSMSAICLLFFQEIIQFWCRFFYKTPREIAQVAM